MWLVGNLTKKLDQMYVTYVRNWLWVMLPPVLRLRCEHHRTMLPAMMYHESASKIYHFHLTYASPFLKPFITYHGRENDDRILKASCSIGINRTYTIYRIYFVLSV